MVDWSINYKLEVICLPPFQPLSRLTFLPLLNFIYIFLLLLSVFPSFINTTSKAYHCIWKPFHYTFMICKNKLGLWDHLTVCLSLSFCFCIHLCIPPLNFYTYEALSLSLSLYSSPLFLLGSLWYHNILYVPVYPLSFSFSMQSVSYGRKVGY
jgi:hypothetical protein